MVSPPTLAREAIYCYLLLLATLLFQLRYIPPTAEYEVHASHIQTLFFLAAALLARGPMPLLGSFDKKLLALCMLFFILALYPSVNSPDPVTAYLRWYCYFSSLLMALGLLLALRAGFISVAGIISVTLVACVALVYAEARDVFQEWQMYREMNKKFLWMPLYFNQIRNFAHVPFTGLVLSAWLVCTPTAGWRRCLGMLLSMLFMTALLWTGGRAPLMVLPICLIVFYYVLPAVSGRRVVWLWLLSAGLGYGLLHFSGNDFMLQNSLTRFGYDFGGVSDLVSLQDMQQGELVFTPSESLGKLGSGRISHWQRGLQLWLEHPVSGNGGDAFFITSGYTFLHPHNWVIRCLLEYGVVGLILVGSALATLLLPALRLIRGDRKNSVMLAVGFTQIVAWVFYGALSGNLYFSWSLAIFAIAAAILSEAVGRYSCFLELRQGSVAVGKHEASAQTGSLPGA